MTLRTAAMKALSVTALVILTVELVPDPALAKPQKWTCNCTISPAERYETCECPGPYSYNIAKSGTKRFWAKCTFRSKGHDIGVVLPKLEVIDKSSKVTCTVVSYPFLEGGYGRKSCTNWGNKQRNSVSFKVICGACGSRDECPEEFTNF